VREVRRNTERGIPLGLAFLVVADIVKTIAVDTTLQIAAARAVVVLIPTFLSFSLGLRLDLAPPWCRHVGP
jgi:uncharacterized membrane protein